jgi:hypothetical protein
MPQLHHHGSRAKVIPTVLYSRIGRKLIDSIRHPTVVHDRTAEEAFGIRPMGLAAAIKAALRNEDREFAATRWSDALAAAGPVRDWGGVRFGSRLVDSRTRRVPVPPAVAFTPIRRIGGETGWYFADWLWEVRGWLDLLAGGVTVHAPGEIASGEGRSYTVFSPYRRAWLARPLPGRQDLLPAPERLPRLGRRLISEALPKGTRGTALP